MMDNYTTNTSNFTANKKSKYIYWERIQILKRTHHLHRKYSSQIGIRKCSPNHQLKRSIIIK